MSTGIEWTDETWNPVTGCGQISPGCAHCYAKTLHDMRHNAFLAGKQMLPQYAQPFEVVQLKPARLAQPIHWRRPRMVFVNSMSDLFHEDVPDDFIAEVWRVMFKVPRHTYQILTKRAERMAALMPRLVATFGVLPHVWLGVSVENQHFLERIDRLKDVEAAVRFVSFEPLLEDLGAVLLDGIQWCIVGGESGPGARPCHVDWVLSILKQCTSAGVRCFVKQLGTKPRTDGDAQHPGTWPLDLKNRKGGDITEWPLDLRIREWPEVRV